MLTMQGSLLHNCGQSSIGLLLLSRSVVEDMEVAVLHDQDGGQD